MIKVSSRPGKYEAQKPVCFRPIESKVTFTDEFGSPLRTSRAAKIQYDKLIFNEHSSFGHYFILQQLNIGLKAKFLLKIDLFDVFRSYPGPYK